MPLARCSRDVFKVTFISLVMGFCQVPAPETTSCRHGYRYICLSCKKNVTSHAHLDFSLYYITHRRGKRFVYSGYWDELSKIVKNPSRIAASQRELSNFLGIDTRTFRHWRRNQLLPKVFTDAEFTLTPANAYFIGLFLSDGHLRRNGAHHSYTYQVGSKDIFQGYWYPQFIQRFLPLFDHKPKLSSTYLATDKSTGAPYLKTNLSSFSPVFVSYLESLGVVKPKTDSPTSSFVKSIPDFFLKQLPHKEAFFQGIFDGDGFVNVHTSPQISIALSPDIDYGDLLDSFPLVSTSFVNSRRETHDATGSAIGLFEVKLAPAALGRMSDGYTAGDVVSQLEFLLRSARHSIRPDKVYKLIAFVERICSKNYGENRNSRPIQAQIRDLAIERGVLQQVRNLKKQYPLKDGHYLPFIPDWARELTSVQDAWEFFFRKEHLCARNLKFGKFFPSGVSVDFLL